MTAVTDTPANRNMLNPLNFRFAIQRAPGVNFFIQAANIPGISVTETDQATPLVVIPQSGEHMQFDELQITFKCDEDLANYLALHWWLRGLGKPEDFHEYAALEAGTSYDAGKGIKSDITLTILNNIKNPNLAVTFTDAFPISLSGLNFDCRSPDTSFIEADATFRYTNYFIKKIV